MSLVVVPSSISNLGLRAVAAMVNTTHRLCLIPPIVVVEVTDTSITFRTSQFTREANARLLEALRDTLGPGYSVERRNPRTPHEDIHVSHA